MPPAGSSNVAIAALSEKVESIAQSMEKLVAVVTADRGANIENFQRVYDTMEQSRERASKELEILRERTSNVGRITWPLIVTTFSTILGFSVVVAGLGSYALKSESTVLSAKIESGYSHLNNRVEQNDRAIEVAAKNAVEFDRDLTNLRIAQASHDARVDTLLEIIRQERPPSPK